MQLSSDQDFDSDKLLEQARGSDLLGFSCREREASRVVIDVSLNNHLTSFSHLWLADVDPSLLSTHHGATSWRGGRWGGVRGDFQTRRQVRGLAVEAHQVHPEPRDEARPADAVPSDVLLMTWEIRRGAGRRAGDGLGVGPRGHGRRNEGGEERAVFRRERSADLVSELFVNVTAKCWGGPGSASGSVRRLHLG